MQEPLGGTKTIIQTITVSFNKISINKYPRSII